MQKKIDLRIERTYLSLNTAFTELMDEKRFEEITVNELCDRAMIRRTTFYKHFADKYEYFTFYVKELAEAFRQRSEKTASVDDVEAYTLNMMNEMLVFIKKNENLVRNIVKSNMSTVLQELLYEYVTTEILYTIKRSPIAKNFSQAKTELLAQFWSGGLMNVVLDSVKKNKEIDANTFRELIKDMIKNAN